MNAERLIWLSLAAINAIAATNGNLLSAMVAVGCGFMAGRERAA